LRPAKFAATKKVPAIQQNTDATLVTILSQVNRRTDESEAQSLYRPVGKHVNLAIIQSAPRFIEQQTNTGAGNGIMHARGWA